MASSPHHHQGTSGPRSGFPCPENEIARDDRDAARARSSKESLSGLILVAGRTIGTIPSAFTTGSARTAGTATTYRTVFFGRNLAVVVFVQLLQRGRGVGDLRFVEDAVAIGIKCHHQGQARYGASFTATASLAGRTVALWGFVSLLGKDEHRTSSQYERCHHCCRGFFHYDTFFLRRLARWLRQVRLKPFIHPKPVFSRPSHCDDRHLLRSDVRPRTTDTRIEENHHPSQGGIQTGLNKEIDLRQASRYRGATTRPAHQRAFGGPLRAPCAAERGAPCCSATSSTPHPTHTVSTNIPH